MAHIQPIYYIAYSVQYGQICKGRGVFAHNMGRKIEKCEEFLICAYGFLAILCVFLIFAYQILGRVCEIFVNRGCGAAAWGILWARRHGDFAGLYGRFWAWVYPYTARHCKAVQRPYMGRIEQKKSPAFQRGGAVVIYCALLSGIRPLLQGVFQRPFQRCGRAFCQTLRQELHQST